MGHFTRTVEDFSCAHCGAAVTGDGYTNHCPRCLWSRHVDIDPGDRAADCGGLMEPVAAGVRTDEWFLVHRCVECGFVRRNRTAPSDDPAAIRGLLGRPIPDAGRPR
ncbi:MAG: RNHCP domain-containing protein [Candidatus Nanopelagicales bacterium]